MTTPNIRVVDVLKRFRRGEVHDSLLDLVPELSPRVVLGGLQSHVLVPGHL